MKTSAWDKCRQRLGFSSGDRCAVSYGVSCACRGPEPWLAGKTDGVTETGLPWVKLMRPYQVEICPALAAMCRDFGYRTPSFPPISRILANPKTIGDINLVEFQEVEFKQRSSKRKKQQAA